MAKKVVLAGACRTAIGTMGGGLSTVPAADLGSIVIKEALKRTNVPADQVDEVLMGCVIQAGLGQNVARQASLNAGLPIEVPAVTINVVCGSGLNCVNLAATKILAGEADIVIAGGMENGSVHFQFLPQLIGIGQVSVMRQRHTSFYMVDHDGLCIETAAGTGGAVPHMSHGDVSLAQTLQHISGKYVIYQPYIFIIMK